MLEIGRKQSDPPFQATTILDSSTPYVLEMSFFEEEETVIVLTDLAQYLGKNVR
jgi:hypothetical protein